MITVDFNALLENNKQIIGNTIFDQLTGAIKGGLQNSGVELKSDVVPIAKNEKEEPSPTAFVDRPWTLIAITGAVVIGFLILRKKGRV